MTPEAIQNQLKNGRGRSYVKNKVDWQRSISDLFILSGRAV